jgi:hypothetical protein
LPFYFSSSKFQDYKLNVQTARNYLYSILAGFNPASHESRHRVPANSPVCVYIRMELTSGLEPPNLFLTKEVLYLLSYVSIHIILERATGIEPA